MVVLYIHSSLFFLIALMISMMCEDENLSFILIRPNWDFLFWAERLVTHTHVRTHWTGTKKRSERERERDKKNLCEEYNSEHRKNHTQGKRQKKTMYRFSKKQKKKNNIILYKLDNSIRKLCLFIYRYQCTYIYWDSSFDWKQKQSKRLVYE